MNKKIIFPAVLLLSAIALAGCSSQANTLEKVSSASSNSNFRRPDFGQPQRQADIRGVVKSSVGNEVTILKIDLKGSRPGSSDLASSSDETKGDEKNTATISLSGQAGSASARRSGMGGGFGGPGGGPESASTSDRAAMLAKIKAMSTGEEKVIIPVGIKMLKPLVSEGKNEPEMVEATLSDVTVDKSITIWLNQNITDKKVAEFVLVN